MVRSIECAKNSFFENISAIIRSILFPISQLASSHQNEQLLFFDLRNLEHRLAAK